MGRTLDEVTDSCRPCWIQEVSGLFLLDHIPGSSASQSHQENGLDYHGEEEDFGRKATGERTS